MSERRSKGSVPHGISCDRCGAPIVICDIDPEEWSMSMRGKGEVECEACGARVLYFGHQVRELRGPNL